MERINTTPRENWQKIVESQGFYYHTLPREELADTSEKEWPQPYWDESAYYRFTAQEIDELEACTYALNDLCLEAAQCILDENLLAEVGIPDRHAEWVRRSWERDEHTIYGRFDLCYDGRGPPKLLEYNADTPTALLEAAVIQWFWMKGTQPPDVCDQFNSIHERLLEIFGTLRRVHDGRFYFASLPDNLEDFMTVGYLRDVAMQAGWDTQYIALADIGWHPGRRQFTDLHESPIRLCFKLYPWEWMMRERFGAELHWDSTRWWEPPWKALLSNKALLAILYRLFPDSPHLLPASFVPLSGMRQIRKPLHGREGANLAVLDEGGNVVRETPGPYAGPYVYQRECPPPCFAGNHAVIGSWLVNGNACGIGVREDTDPITTNRSRFVPHIFSR